MVDINENFAPYMVGGLLYTPAIHIGIADKIANNSYPCLTSMAFCLEDSIEDKSLKQAEVELKRTLDAIIYKNIPNKQLPMLFVRIRSPEHMEYIHEFLGEAEQLLTGYILPKFDTSNAKHYMSLIHRLNHEKSKKLYAMPILESKMIADLANRTENLLEIKHILNNSKDFILNVRVGGNDFSNLYGLRRPVTKSIYDIGVIRDILVDIINVFASDYIVSGPVWEYFGNNPNEAWATGLKNELERDKLNGFIGKTAIHPMQLPLIYESMKVCLADYNDALRILNWNSDTFAVQKSAGGTRMNEIKCHRKWASRIAILGQIYGIREG